MEQEVPKTKRKKPRTAAHKRATAKLFAMNKKKKRKSTRKGQRRKTARRAYEGLKRKVRRTKRKTNKDSMWSW